MGKDITDYMVPSSSKGTIPKTPKKGNNAPKKVAKKDIQEKKKPQKADDKHQHLSTQDLINVVSESSSDDEELPVKKAKRSITFTQDAQDIPETENIQDAQTIPSSSSDDSDDDTEKKIISPAKYPMVVKPKELSCGATYPVKGMVYRVCNLF